MAHRKAGGTAKNLTDSNPQYLGIKLYEGEAAKPGAIIVRQRGSRIVGGTNTKTGKDDTIYAVKSGKVKFGQKRVSHFDGTKKVKKVVSVI